MQIRITKSKDLKIYVPFVHPLPTVQRVNTLCSCIELLRRHTSSMILCVAFDISKVTVSHWGITIEKDGRFQTLHPTVAFPMSTYRLEGCGRFPGFNFWDESQVILLIHVASGLSRLLRWSVVFCH